MTWLTTHASRRNVTATVSTLEPSRSNAGEIRNLAYREALLRDLCHPSIEACSGTFRNSAAKICPHFASKGLTFAFPTW
jgi:hypothetical protein